MRFLHKAKLLGILDHVNYSTKFLKKRHANYIFLVYFFHLISKQAPHLRRWAPCKFHAKSKAQLI